jgi:hypothetical protein
VHACPAARRSSCISHVNVSDKILHEVCVGVNPIDLRHCAFSFAAFILDHAADDRNKRPAALNLCFIDKSTLVLCGRSSAGCVSTAQPGCTCTSCHVRVFTCVSMVSTAPRLAIWPTSYLGRDSSSPPVTTRTAYVLDMEITGSFKYNMCCSLVRSHLPTMDTRRASGRFRISAPSAGGHAANV